mgnify:CR=1 FL=1
MRTTVSLTEKLQKPMQETGYCLAMQPSLKKNIVVVLAADQDAIVAVRSRRRRSLPPNKMLIIIIFFIVYSKICYNIIMHYALEVANNKKVMIRFVLQKLCLF